jgi:RNA polymerase sigma-70 factor (ECF subfamily)
VRLLSDGAGEFNAAIRPVIGRTQVAALFAGLAKVSAPVVASEPRVLNGLPALVVERAPAPDFASRFTIQAEIDDEGPCAESTSCWRLAS